MFGKDGMVHLYPSIRRHLWLVLDDGWDVPYGMTGDDNYRHGRFGSLIVDGERFPSCTGTPAERLAQLSRRVKEHGWRGLGLWICANACGEYWGHFQTPEEQEHYWRERLRWCRETGIGYWKVDWGHHDRSAAFRRRLSVWAAEEAPALVVEHSGVVAPFSGIEDHDDSAEHSGRFADWRDEPMRCAELMRFSQVYRTYDVSAELSVPTTLDRVQFPLRMAEFTGSPTVLNCEDEPLIGAVLGCAIGIMRSSLPAFGTSPYCRTAEVIRAIRWQTAFAPAFAPTAVSPGRGRRACVPAAASCRRSSIPVRKPGSSPAAIRTEPSAPRCSPASERRDAVPLRRRLRSRPPCTPPSGCLGLSTPPRSASMSRLRGNTFTRRIWRRTPLWRLPTV